MYGWHGAQLLSWNLVKTMDNDYGYENNALEKVTPRRYDQIWVCAVSVAASYWIQRVNLSFESPHPTATKDKLAPALVHRWNCWHVDIHQTEVYMLTHTHTCCIIFFFGHFPTAAAWWKGWMFPIPAASDDLFPGKSWNKTPSRFAAFNRNLRPGSLETGGSKGWPSANLQVLVKLLS